MSDDEQRRRERGLRLIAPLTVVAVVAVLILVTVANRWRAPSSPPPAPAVATAPQPVTPAPIRTEVLPLQRAELLSRAADEAAAFAGGESLPQDETSLANRAFTLRIPFACEGVQGGGSGEQAYAAFDPEKRTLRLVAQPADWSTLPMFAQAAEALEVEAVEGFWVPRPWLRTEECPPRQVRQAAPATPTPPAAQSLGLAVTFDPSSSRVARRGARPYEFVRKLGADETAPLSHSYRLVLEGRIATFPGGQSLRCWSETPAHRPICIYAVVFDRVAFEDASDGEVLAEWRE